MKVKYRSVNEVHLYLMADKEKEQLTMAVTGKIHEAFVSVIFNKIETEQLREFLNNEVPTNIQ